MLLENKIAVIYGAGGANTCTACNRHGDDLRERVEISQATGLTAKAEAPVLLGSHIKEEPVWSIFQ